MVRALSYSPSLEKWSLQVLAEKPGPRRQILCEFLIEEINQTLGVPEAIEPSFTSTTTPITDQQTGLEENETITRTIITTASENPEKGSSSSVAGQTTLIVNCVHIDQNYSAIEEFQPITFLKYKNQPTTKMDTNDGWRWGYHQLCNSFTKNESYDITQESWYNSPCKVCDSPMTTKVNISWQNDVKNYIETKNCSEDEGDVLKAAEAYYIKLHSQPAEIEYHKQYYTNETWEYIDRMNQAFHDHREAIVEKLPKLLDLRKHHRHQSDQINLCHSCLCPYLNSELITIGKRILCTYIKGQNENPCYKEQWDEDNKENNQPEEIDEYLCHRNKDYQDRFLVYLDRNMQWLKETSLPYECEFCEKPLDRPQVHQVVRNVSCGECVKEWAKELYQKEKEAGTLGDKPKPMKGGNQARIRRPEEKREANDSSRDD
ncbi:2692_t:CDS:2 [Entrophospora sp. SA101]|nr:2692_t:CDS:2 [Entrophospora sp. SA101]